MVRVMEERYRRLLGLEDGVLSEYLFIAFCRKYAQDDEDRYHQLQQFIQLCNLVETVTASPQHPIAAASASDDEQQVFGLGPAMTWS